MIRKLLTIVIILLTLSGYASAADPFFTDVIVTSTDGIWTDSRAYSSLSDAITAVGANERVITIVNEQTANNLTIPDNVTLRFERNGTVNITGTLTLHPDSIEAPDRQIFTGTGTAQFGEGSVVRSSWYADFVTAASSISNALTLVVSERSYVTADVAFHSDSVLKFESPENQLVANAGFTLSGIKNIEAGNYVVFTGAGDFDFLDGTRLKLDWFTRLRSVLTWVEDEEVTIVVSGTNNVTYTITADSNELFDFNSENGQFSVSGGQTLTFDSPEVIIARPRNHIFAGAGTIRFTNGGTIYPDWWGAIPGDATSDSTEIQAAIDCAEANAGGVIRFSTGRYRLNAGLVVNSHKIKLIGKGQRFTYLDFYGSSAPTDVAIRYVHSTDNSINRCILRDLSINAYVAAVDKIAVKIEAGFFMEIRRVTVEFFETGKAFEVTSSALNGQSIQVNFYHTITYMCLTGLHLTSHDAGTHKATEIGIFNCAFTWDNSVAAFTGVHMEYANTVRFINSSAVTTHATFPANSTGIKIENAPSTVRLIAISPMLEHLDVGIDIPANMANVLVMEPSYTGNDDDIVDLGNRTTYINNGTVQSNFIAPTDAIEFVAGLDDGEINNIYRVNGRDLDGILHIRGKGTGPVYINHSTGSDMYFMGGTGSPIWLWEDEGFQEGVEVVDPASPVANKGRIYFRDNGAGKTQLVVRFATGAIQVIATQP